MPLLINKQKGLALITVLFIFALVSLLAISMQSRQILSMAQAEASINITQSQLLALSAEDVAIGGLKFDGQRDLDQNKPWDTSSELWNKAFPANLSGAAIEIHFRDLQGLFNLNSLALGAPDRDAAQIRFERLLSDLLLPTTIASNVKDWMDSANSSANSIYQNYEPPYSASGLEFSHPSELMLIEGVTHEDYMKIEPYIAALPKDAKLNINTTHGQILSAWDSDLTIDDAKTVVAVAHGQPCGQQARDKYVFEDVDAFWNNSIINPLVKVAKSTSGKWVEGDFDVQTKFFSAFIKITIEDRILVLESIIQRDMNSKSPFVGVVYRDFSRKVEDISRLVIDMKINKC